ncbi:hypothetical protein CYQ88_03190 [Hydrogenovibrio sp. SC-1]|uniref:hypothetical protein n=1 Tax=Hydrogenovibrio sp. SC-1 TaxID=2065820 RepID=UPI000C7DCBFE|nr:hypothetical protein [Hydrogenovibrio sp. SC-1]PLA74922.1 hypothetical protein CYQ88_03190 [Hydrogenovibrio sp. SC-1]
MIKIANIISVSLLVAFALQSTADAASISTRVRILEGKVYKQSKLLEQQSSQTQSYSKELKRGLQELEILKREVKGLKQKEQKTTKKKKLDPQVSKPYSFP